MSTLAPVKKSKKVSFVVTFDSDLKEKVEAFAELHHTDLSTLLGLSVEEKIDTVNHPVGPHYTASPEYIRKLDEMMARIDRGEEEVFWPFEWKAAIDFLNKYI